MNVNHFIGFVKAHYFYKFINIHNGSFVRDIVIVDKATNEEAVLLRAGNPDLLGEAQRILRDAGAVGLTVSAPGNKANEEKK